MIIVTAAEQSFRELVKSGMAMNEKCGYKTIVYDIGGLGFGIPFNISDDVEMIENNSHVLYTGTTLQKGSFKPKIILDAMNRFPEEKEITWLDADAYCVGRIHDLFQKYEFDIGVTMRNWGEFPNSPHPMFDCYINSGVVFINNTEKSREIVKKWCELVPQTYALSDQEAINVLLDAPKLIEVNSVYIVNGIRVLVLSTEEYNYYYFPKVPGANVKVLHFKGVKKNTMQYFKKYLTV